MKYTKFFFGFLLFIVLTFYNYCFADKKEDDKSINLLSENEIDLLVGTPEGVAEPLDSRRNTITKDNQVDYSCYLDDNALLEDDKIQIDWEDAEDNIPNESQVESQLMDLLAETEELEKIDEIYYNEENDISSDTKMLSLGDFSDY